jgi:hypothetical protein
MPYAPKVETRGNNNNKINKRPAAGRDGSCIEPLNSEV